MPLPRPEIEQLTPSAHGGPNQAELASLGLKAEDIIDFSVCSDPFASPPELSEIIDRADISRLPDSEATELRKVLSEKLSIPGSHIIAGNGSLEPIRLIAQAYFGPGDTILIAEPTFGEYRVACQIAGAKVSEQRAREDDDFAHRIDEMVALIKRGHLKGVFICNPNNPTGHYMSREEIEAILDVCRETLLVLDEAYISFVDESWYSLDLVEKGNVIILRSMTKDQALAGLRLGYAVAHPDIINTLRKVQPPWSVNTVAQRAGIAVIRNSEGKKNSKEDLRKAKQFLTDQFCRLGYSPLPSDTHFFLVKTENAAEFHDSLLRQGLRVRDCASFGLKNYIRIAARTMPECRKLIKAIEKTKKGDK